ncbi:unnamed protein product [Mycena citricolor]|uniref:Diphthine--ammonia ligase n=1 Tax=Mycena citricolor TaxID=2018698 RepID=A0AAD2HIK6_9AGAR|nr:unnamed protein product [Mycena citricolor]
MKYVALLSGGKDSCYNLLHCKKNGHELIAAASLGPEPGKEELDSYMYQTVGQDAIELVAQALDVPLYRRIIAGNAVEQGSEYGARNNHEGVVGDETEDLYELLLNVKTHHPDLEGVSVGAILSNYQRVRVEHVCRRLSLTPLSYLWQRDQGELMSEMVEAGMEAILIKVAGIGLTVKHLGKTLAQMQPTLIKLNQLYGAHICGEGGEYETLTLDCPMFKKRIHLIEVEPVIHSDNAFATVAFLRIKRAVLEEKEIDVRTPRQPPLLDEPLDVESTPRPEALGGDAPVSLEPLGRDETQSKQCGQWVSVSNVCAGPGVEAIEDEVLRCFLGLKDELFRYGLDFADCVNLNVLLSSMELFPRMNAVYATFFGTSPPARACVAVDLPGPYHVRLDCIAHSKTEPRTALHVQGLSYWAPANIGPYSQSVTIGNRVYVSGQIGLVPSSMTMPSPRSVQLETALSSQHASRVVEALRTTSGNWPGRMQLAIFWLADTSHLKIVANQSPEEATPTLFVVVKGLPKDALVEKQIMLHTGSTQVTDDGELVTQDRKGRFRAGESSSGVHWQISEIEDTPSASILLCGRYGDPIQTELDHLLSQVLSVKMFYIPASTSADLYDRTRDAFGAPVIGIPCRAIATRNRDNWDYALCIVT